MILSHVSPFHSIFSPVLFTANCQKSLKLSKNTETDTVSVKKQTNKNLFDTDSQKLRARLETDLAEVGGSISAHLAKDNAMLKHKTNVSSANTLVCTFPSSR